MCSGITQCHLQDEAAIRLKPYTSSGQRERQKQTFRDVEISEQQYICMKPTKRVLQINLIINSNQAQKYPLFLSYEKLVRNEIVYH